MARLKKPVSFAFDQSLIDLIDKLANDLGISKSQVVELAVSELNKRGIRPDQIVKTISIAD